jgi:murein DD-endopeptidase MepM/ murein hydrolase activator NlpD
MRVQLAIAMLLATALIAADRPPWRPRKRPSARPNELASERVTPADWASEPDAPGAVEPRRFAQALESLCSGYLPKDREDRYAEWMLRYGSEFDVDPFLLGALIFRQSRCRPDSRELGGVGLTSLVPGMYQGALRGGVYRYRVRDGGQWREHTKTLARFPFGPVRLVQAEPNLYFTAALLSAWREQHPSVDEAFPQVPHRHWVSHWVWGDEVRSARAEDRIFTDRRRLLHYYGALAPRPPLTWLGLALGAPLDGAPRVVSSGIGFAREDARKHRGIDVEAVHGEPVRAIADGRVAFSGVDLPGRRNNLNLEPEETNAHDRRALGNGGRYVCIVHGEIEGQSLRSCSMHLDTVEVRAGDAVERGRRIGAVGRTGMKESSPHLHLEMYLGETLLDASAVLRGHLIGAPRDPR